MVTRYNGEEIPAVYDTDDIAAYEQRPGFTVRCFRSLHTTFGLVHAEGDAERSLSLHPWEQTVYVLAGEAAFSIDGEEFPISAGDIFFVPPSVEHELRPTPGQSVDLFVAWPLREDFLQYTDYQREFER